jgi:hypothetical protein
MWTPADPDEPTSELYRLMPPRRRSELREALDAASGRDHDDRDPAGAEPLVVLSGSPAGRKYAERIGRFFVGALSNGLGGIITVVALALAAFLWAHFHHAGHPPAPPVRPAVTTPAGRP